MTVPLICKFSHVTQIMTDGDGHIGLFREIARLFICVPAGQQKSVYVRLTLDFELGQGSEHVGSPRISMSLHFLPWLSCSHPLVKVHSSRRWWKPSMTSGFPPRITCSNTSFSTVSMPWVSIISHEIRVTYSKFGVCWTSASRSRSGEIGSKAADRRAVGILDDGEVGSRGLEVVSRVSS